MNSEKVLCVDDEPKVLSALKRLLRRRKFDVTVTSDPDEARRLVRQEQFAVVVSDQRMPEVSGTDLLKEVCEASPDSVRILLTGYADIDASIDAINESGVFRYVTKPWDDRELVSIVQQAAESHSLTSQNRELARLTAKQNLALREFTLSLEDRVAQRTQEVQELAARLHDTLYGATEILGLCAERHSETSGHHSRRVARLAEKIGERLCLSDAELLQLRYGSALHDLGKLSVAQEILTKDKSDLTEREKCTIAEHVVHGEALISLIPNMEMAALFVRHHHERFDGTGYPDQLCGDEIPMGARIIAVADAFDNLLNSGESGRGTTFSAAVELIRQWSGTWFDPDVVAVLAEIIGEKTVSNSGAEVAEGGSRPDDRAETQDAPATAPEAAQA